jgi:hypothetical protein
MNDALVFKAHRAIDATALAVTVSVLGAAAAMAGADTTFDTALTTFTDFFEVLISTEK